MAAPRALILLALVAGVAAPRLAAAASGERCAAAKLHAAGQKATGQLRCHARGLVGGGGADAACLAKAEAKFASAWARIEGHGGCATTNDATSVEQRVDAFVDGLVAALPPTTSTTSSTTVTPTSTCPPLTAFYCAISACPGFGPPPLCPTGMTCVTAGTSCECVGDPIPCGSLSGNLCRWGTCPAGTTCGSDAASTSCPRGCSCQ